jgi:pre-mRNA-splicing factor ATP-dependent RNA helicase DHX15/PRP43
MSKMLIVSPEFNCSQEILTIVAMLSGPLFFLLHVLMRLIVSFAVPNIWIRPKDKRKEADIAKQLLSIPDGDHLTLLNVFDEYQNSTYRSDIFSPLLTKTWLDLRDPEWAWENYVSAHSLAEAANVRAQVLRIMERLEIDLVTKSYKDQTSHYGDIRRALVCGYFTQVALKTDSEGSYLTVKDNQVRPHP